jgi:signal transduction histidine kinase
VVGSLKTFARLDEASVEHADVSEGLRSALVLLQPSVPAGVEMRVDVPELPKIACRPSELNLAFMAVLTNAVEAMQGRAGRIEVSARAEAKALEVRVADAGRGIPSREQARLFEPRLVRRGRRVKMGLGLSTAKSVIDAHGGDIDVESVEGAGTRVRIRIPR